jgi:hypothetical protein
MCLCPEYLVIVDENMIQVNTRGGYPYRQQNPSRLAWNMQHGSLSQAQEMGLDWM